MDCVVGGRLCQTLSLPGGAVEALFSGLEDGIKDVEIWLPQNIGITVTGLRIDAHAVGVRCRTPGPAGLRTGAPPSASGLPAPPALGLPLPPKLAASATNLGFSGNCHMEPMIGRLIRDLPADFISICAGVNIYGGGTLSPRMFKPLLIGLLETIRDKHRDTPLLVISPIYGTVRETQLNSLGFTLPIMREIIRETVELLRARGDRQLFYRDGLKWFGPEDEAFDGWSAPWSRGI